MGALGVENGTITEGQMTASSYLEKYGMPSLARLNNKHIPAVTNGCWVPKVKDNNQWLQIDIARIVGVSRVATQGNDASIWWVTSYMIGYSLDGSVWSVYQENGAEFPGNTDRSSIVYNRLSPPVATRLIRFYPKGWNVNISLRVEIYGC
ncbi:predicted protein [Nematostella vectensis]|uniref:F5/8 type C domain-containing protein n=1 Tax=Nematostella vectensis TaxID=45351 RepID=A7SPF4_NEMVE|nr:predicted protein [Nematostella vectensis]|eukprot:XP_001626496.1 predicted protein [Nematostella vectensis]